MDVPQEIFFVIGSHCIIKDRLSLLSTCKIAHKASKLSYPRKHLWNVSLTEKQINIVDMLLSSSEENKALITPSGWGKTLVTLSYLFSLPQTDKNIFIVVEKSMINYWINEIQKTFPSALRKNPKDSRILLYYSTDHNHYKYFLKNTVKGKIILTNNLVFYRMTIETNKMMNLISPCFLFETSHIVYDTLPNGHENPRELINYLYLISKDNISKRWKRILVEEHAQLPLSNYRNISCYRGLSMYTNEETMEKANMVLMHNEICKQSSKRKILIVTRASGNLEGLRRSFVHQCFQESDYFNEIHRFNSYQGENNYTLVMNWWIGLTGYGIFPNTCIVLNIHKEKIKDRIIQSRNPYKTIDFYCI